MRSLALFCCLLFLSAALNLEENTMANDGAASLSQLLREHNQPVEHLAAWPELKPSVGEVYRRGAFLFFDLRKTSGAVQVSFPRLNNRVTTVRRLGDTTKYDSKAAEIKLTQTPRVWTIWLPPSKTKNASRVVVLELKGAPLLTKEIFTIAPSADGGIVLPAHHAEVHGEKLQYEPLPHKNTVGYWVEVDAWARWSFTVVTPGAYELEILQGCGKGHGGSDVDILIDGQDSSFQAVVSFQVEDTGHFQNFRRRQLGQVQFSKPGRYTLEIRPRKLAAKAVMDVRQVRLTPVHSTDKD